VNHEDDFIPSDNDPDDLADDSDDEDDDDESLEGLNIDKGKYKYFLLKLLQMRIFRVC
jgi:hypothetical protein